jgi:hypothetical protein
MIVIFSVSGETASLTVLFKIKSMLAKADAKQNSSKISLLKLIENLVLNC